MSNQISFEEKELQKKLRHYIKTNEIEITPDNNVLVNCDFICQEFPWRGEYIQWKAVPNSEYYQVKIPYRPEESRDFTTRIIEKNNLQGQVTLYGDVILQNNYRMDISLLPSVLWDFMPIPICLYAVNPEQKWCFSFNSYDDLNFGYALEKASTK